MEKENSKKYIPILEKMHPGDIILSIFNRKLSNIMQHRTGCKYHHAQFYFKESSYIHSYQQGVQASNPMRDLYELEDDMVILRLKDPKDNLFIPGAIKSVQSKVGTAYSDDELFRVLKAGEMESIEENRQICTRLVAQAYSESGIKIVKNPDYCTLQELVTSDKLQVISGVLRLGSDDEIRYALEGSKALRNQEAIQNWILEQARTVTGEDIQTLQQLEKFIIANPKHDGILTQVVRDSGYLDMWKLEMEKNPQHYDFDQLIAYYPPKQYASISTKFLSIAQDNLNSYKVLLRSYEEMYKQHPLGYIQIHITLLGNLIDMFSKMEIAMFLLIAHLAEFDDE
jgi:hypothetical protein